MCFQSKAQQHISAIFYLYFTCSITPSAPCVFAIFLALFLVISPSFNLCVTGLCSIVLLVVQFTSQNLSSLLELAVLHLEAIHEHLNYWNTSGTLEPIGFPDCDFSLFRIYFCFHLRDQSSREDSASWLVV